MFQKRVAYICVVIMAAAGGYFVKGALDARRQAPQYSSSEQTGAPNNIVVAGRFQKYERGYLFDTATGRVCVPGASLDNTIIVGENGDKAMEDFKKGMVDSCVTVAAFYAVKTSWDDSVPLLLRKTEEISKNPDSLPLLLHKAEQSTK